MISTADLAAFVAELLGNDAYIKQAPFVASV